MGDFFGELSLLEELPRKESARAVTNYKLLKIDYPTFDLIVQQKPEIAIRMLHKLSERLQESQENSFNSAHISRQVASKLLQNCHSLRIAFTNLAKRASQNVRRLPEKLQRNPQTGLNLQIIPDNNLKESSENPTTQPPQPKTTKIKSPEGVLVHIKTGREFTLHNDAEQSIGRLDRNTSSSTNINFSEFDFNRTLSKRHAIIAGRQDGFHLYEETESRNGSFVNGTRVKPGVSIKLQDGDKVTFGLIETTFKKR